MGGLHIAAGLIHATPRGQLYIGARSDNRNQPRAIR